MFNLAENQDYLDEKLKANKDSTALIYLLQGTFAVFFWVWDYLVDPIGAVDTVSLRLSFFLMGVFAAILFKYSNNKYILVSVFPIIIVFAELVFILIMTKLELGMIYGLQGFVFIAFLPLFTLSAFSFPIKVFSSITMGAAPSFLALTGLADGFPHGIYLAVMWPTVILVIILQYILSKKDLFQYESTRSLEAASNTDYLTGISNRRHFMSCLKQELIRASRLKHHTSLLMIDIDHFKKINDSYGHMAGDLAIVSLVEVITTSIRPFDTAGRLGGEEFTVLLPETDIKKASIIAERIRIAIEETLIPNKDKDSFNITVSIGITGQEDGYLLADEFLSNSDDAMYAAKTSGRNQIAIHQ